MLSEESYYDFDLQKNWGKQLKEAYMFCQWIKKDIVKELIYNRESDLVIEPSECSDNPATGLHYSSLGQAERACRDLDDDDYIPTIVEFGAQQLENIAFNKETK